jgi:predicted nuclease of predicted toxin-antitoxin system
VSVKLLFDQNLSPKLVKRLSDLYSNSDHLDLLGLGTAEDTLVWEHAKDNDFVVVTKDADFADLSVLRGFPPKVVWIRRGNCSTTEIENLLRDHNSEIEDLAVDSTSGILTLF